MKYVFLGSFAVMGLLSIAAVMWKPGASDDGRLDIVWVCDDNHHGCSDCDDNSLAGSIRAGEAFPTGHLCAPAHIGCRCILLPAGR